MSKISFRSSALALAVVVFAAIPVAGNAQEDTPTRGPYGNGLTRSQFDHEFTEAARHDPLLNVAGSTDQLVFSLLMNFPSDNMKALDYCVVALYDGDNGLKFPTYPAHKLGHTYARKCMAAFERLAPLPAP